VRACMRACVHACVCQSRIIFSLCSLGQIRLATEILEILKVS